MDKLEFISKQLSKNSKKIFENYVTSRIYHLLNDFDMKLVTQQYVSGSNGRWITDIFFPQIKFHIEIDERHHLSQIEWDNLRAADIIDATKHQMERIKITNVSDVNKRIDEIVKLIQKNKASLLKFVPWDIDAEMNPQTHINNRYIDVNEDCAFRTMVDAANCFGRNFKQKGIWKGGVDHLREPNKCIWFPKLYENINWKNSISFDEEEIREKSKKDAMGHYKKFINDSRSRIVFAHAKGPLGDTLYRFKGEYELCKEGSSIEHGLMWKRIKTRVTTYPCV